MIELETARRRTNDKLQYAKVHLSELTDRRREDDSRGGHWERAHQESFLYHLVGVRDALLQEINIAHACGLKPRDVSMRALSDKLMKLGRQSRALRTLARLEGMKSSWSSIARRMRNHFTHQKDLPRRFHKGGGKDGMVYVADPLADELKKRDLDQLARSERSIVNASETDCVALFAEWCKRADRLVENLRSKMPGAENG